MKKEGPKKEHSNRKQLFGVIFSSQENICGDHGLFGRRGRFTSLAFKIGGSRVFSEHLAAVLQFASFIVNFVFQGSNQIQIFFDKSIKISLAKLINVG